MKQFLHFNIFALEKAHRLILCVSLAFSISQCLLNSTFKVAGALIKRVYSSSEYHQYH